MRKNLIYLLIMAVFIASCANDCDDNCKKWEYCNIDTDTCMLKNGACNNAKECLYSDDICLKNKCVEHAKCEEWESYVDTTNSCNLSEERCNSDTQCLNNEEHCNLDTHRCIDNFQIIFSKDCPSYLSSNAECSMVKLPLDYNNPDGKKIDIFVFRHLSKSRNVKGQIWFLQGGPGGGASTFSKYVFDEYMKTHPEYDYYTLDHRGVGNSSMLRCDNRSLSCKDDLDEQMGDDIQQYSTTNAAKDLGFLISKTKEDNKKVFVNGASYGTYWAQRYLTIFPSQADGVILDSICTLGHCYLDYSTYWFDTTGKEVLKICENNKTCNEKMKTITVDGVEPSDVTPELAVKQVISNSRCKWWDNSFLTEQNWHHLLSDRIVKQFERVIMPAIIYRVNRCEDRDKRALDNLKEIIMVRKKKNNYVSEKEAGMSYVLQHHIITSELWFGKMEKEEFIRTHSNYLFADAISFESYINQSQIPWNRYTDEYISQTKPDVKTAILMLQGTLDPQTPIEIAKFSKDFLNKENQYFIEFPEVVHGASANSLIINNLRGETCGDRIMFEFIKNPNQKPNTKCIDDLVNLNWNPDSEMKEINDWLSNYFFGTKDMWDGDPADKKKTIKNSNFDKTMNELIKREQSNLIQHH